MEIKSDTTQGGWSSFLMNRSDILVASSVIMILLVMIMPIPAVLLDFFLAMNISLSIIVLLVAFYTLKPLQFAVFPGMLLILTLFRLSLNVASTRLILSEGYAGNLIEAFGSFVVQGNFVIGIIIFAVLIIINFVVITKGASRIAEVSARFTLDAMPGKQMAIDADLSAGLISDDEAKARREEIARESDFYGAMDGASKFVRGDVIAGLLITFINIIGGLIVGSVQQGMPIGDAAAQYTLLTVGDGLVSQIPALLISTGSGIIVTRAASEGSLSFEITTQLFGNPKVISLAAVFILIMGLIPGMPFIPFMIFAGGLFYHANKKSRRDELEIIEEQEKIDQDGQPEEKVEQYLLMDTLELEIGYSLIPLVDPDQGGDLLDRMSSLRKQMAIELGMLVPPIRIRDNVQLKSNHYTIKMRGILQGEGELLPEYHLVLLPENLQADIKGVKTKDPAYGMDAVWVSNSNRAEAEKYGLSIIKAGAVITTHMIEVIKRNADKLLDRQMVKTLVDNLKESAPAVVEELVPNKMSYGELQKILKRLLKEGIPIRDMNTILETVADYHSKTQNPDVLTEYVRAALAETITRTYRDGENSVTTAVLESSLEGHLISQAQQGNLHPGTLGFTPETVEKLYMSATRVCDKMSATGHKPIILTSPVLRPALYDFLVSVIPDVVVLSYNDLTIDTQIHKFGAIELSQEHESQHEPALT
ncbi:flagellar biosynthesis protein FlhA [Rhodohalobacter mucosus]|uniref:Flagellar biosynthesis protein FlhA n=1 Tax=Rhodohalobacter mucosus TaxID=2079485 RepID=A0A316TKW3_9BACT|nr:flagellar biosynthesis protein FlhA [Rhodohalobacter mucosus]PWN05193.1 flagellar biosynthesis protein FlhA [Rhodohalobacter mucosus]